VRYVGVGVASRRQGISGSSSRCAFGGARASVFSIRMAVTRTWSPAGRVAMRGRGLGERYRPAVYGMGDLMVNCDIMVAETRDLDAAGSGSRRESLLSSRLAPFGWLMWTRRGDGLSGEALAVLVLLHCPGGRAHKLAHSLFAQPRRGPGAAANRIGLLGTIEILFGQTTATASGPGRTDGGW